MEILYYILTLIIFSILILSIFYNYFKYLKRDSVYNHSAVLLTIIEINRELSYKKLFREDVLSYNLSGYRVTGKDLIDLKKRHLSQLFNYLGPKIIDDIELLYGDIDSFAERELAHLVLKLEDDQNLTFSASTRRNNDIESSDTE